MGIWGEIKATTKKPSFWAVLAITAAGGFLLGHIVHYGWRW